MKHKHSGFWGANQLSHIPESLSVSKLLQGRTEEEWNKWDDVALRATITPINGTNTKNIQSCTHQGVTCFHSPRIRLTFHVFQMSWLSERLCQLAARPLFVSNSGLAVCVLAPDGHQLNLAIKQQHHVWTLILKTVVSLEQCPTLSSHR